MIRIGLMFSGTYIPVTIHISQIKTMMKYFFVCTKSKNKWLFNFLTGQTTAGRFQSRHCVEGKRWAEKHIKQIGHWSVYFQYRIYLYRYLIIMVKPTTCSIVFINRTKKCILLIFIHVHWAYFLIITYNLHWNFLWWCRKQ